MGADKIWRAWTRETIPVISLHPRNKSISAHGSLSNGIFIFLICFYMSTPMLEIIESYEHILLTKIYKASLISGFRLFFYIFLKKMNMVSIFRSMMESSKRIGTYTNTKHGNFSRIKKLFLPCPHFIFEKNSIVVTNFVTNKGI